MSQQMAVLLHLLEYSCRHPFAPTRWVEEALPATQDLSGGLPAEAAVPQLPTAIRRHTLVMACWVVGLGVLPPPALVPTPA
jgi:hypothetical protein